MSASTNRNLLSILKFAFIFLISWLLSDVISAVSGDFHEYFLCRKCGHNIVQLKDLTNTPSKLALRQRNDTFGPKREVLIQLFKNPHDIMFEVVTANKANVHEYGEEVDADTWWRGFNWKMLICPQCRQHIGWSYIPMDKKDIPLKSFFGLVLGNLLYENDADNLLVIPKSYQS